MKNSIFSKLFLISLLLLGISSYSQVKVKPNTTNKKVIVKNNRNNNKKVIVNNNRNNNKKVIVKTNRVVVNKPNRPKVIVNRPNYNRPGYVWIEGYWKWNRFKRKYVWKKAKWKKIKRNHQWIPGYWHIAPNGFFWVEGYWQLIY